MIRHLTDHHWQPRRPSPHAGGSGVGVDLQAIVHQKLQTYVEATEAGRRAFEEHRRALQAILDNG